MNTHPKHLGVFYHPQIVPFYKLTTLKSPSPEHSIDQIVMSLFEDGST